MILLIFILSFLFKDFLFLLLLYGNSRNMYLIINIVYLFLLSKGKFLTLIPNIFILYIISKIINISYRNYFEKRLIYIIFVFYFLLFIEYLIFGIAIKYLVYKIIISLILNTIFVRIIK